MYSVIVYCNVFCVFFFIIKEEDLEKWTDSRYVFQIKWTGLGCGYERERSVKHLLTETGWIIVPFPGRKG